MIKLFCNDTELLYSVKIFPDKTKTLEFYHPILTDIINKAKNGDKIVMTYRFDYDDASIDSEDVLFLSYIKDYIREIIPVVSEHVLIMPYIPNARNDRKQNRYDFFTLKYFSNYINNLNFDEVRVIDPHSDVSKGLLNNCIPENLTSILGEIIKNRNYNTIAFPDSGSFKKYMIFLKDFLDDKTIIIGNKERNFKTGEIVSYNLNIIGTIDNDSKILIVDDICSYGGTFKNFVNCLNNNISIKPKLIDLYVTYVETAFLMGDLYNQKLINNLLFRYSLTTQILKKINFNKFNEEIFLYEIKK